MREQCATSFSTALCPLTPQIPPASEAAVGLSFPSLSTCCSISLLSFSWAIQIWIQAIRCSSTLKVVKTGLALALSKDALSVLAFTTSAELNLSLNSFSQVPQKR